jgi:hypothetical protein
MVVSFDEPHVAWFFRRLNSCPRFAHHPVCDCFDNHLIRIGKSAFCLGCFCLGAGLIATAALLVLLYTTLGVPQFLSIWWVAWLLGVALYVTTLAQPFFQAKRAKVLFRMALGASIALLWYGTLFCLSWEPPGIAMKAMFLVCFATVFRLTLQFRARHTPDPRLSCGRGCWPLCAGNRPALDGLLNELRFRSGGTDPEFLAFAEGMISGGTRNVEVEHVVVHSPN